ncbi:MAG: helix-turn-helix domain-containing protein [Thermoplasmata archaeon]
MKPKFSAENIGCDNVLDCLYNLSKMDKEVLSLMSEDEEYRSRDIAERIDKDQSTAYRILEKLVGCGLVYKEKKTIRNGGYYYVYSARPIDKVREEAEQCLENWYSDMKKALEDMNKI